MRAKEALIQSAVLEGGEAAAPGGQLAHRIRRLPSHDLDHPWMAEEVALPQRVGEMLLPGILRIPRAKHGVDATRRQDRMGIETVSFAHDQHLAARLGRRDRRAQPSGASADDEHVADAATGRRLWHPPSASYRREGRDCSLPLVSFWSRRSHREDPGDRQDRSQRQ